MGLKVLRRRWAEDPKLVAQFMREAQQDENGDLYVMRRPRSDKPSPPPGTKLPKRKTA